MITEAQIKYIKQTWSKLAAKSNALGDALYPKLFAKRPELETLFSVNKSTNSQKIFLFVMMIVTKLDKIENLMEELQNLAKRHVGYGVKIEDFEAFGEAFKESVQEILPAQTPQEALAAWGSLYDTVADAMIVDMSKLLHENPENTTSYQKK